MIHFLALIIVSLTVAIHMIFMLRLHINLVIGIRRGDHHRLYPFLFMAFIGIFAGFFTLPSFDLMTIAFASISSLVHLYLFICLFSLHERFKKKHNYDFSQ